MELTEQHKREIGQHFVVGYSGTELGPEIRELIGAPYYVGNVILMKRNVKDAGQLRRITEELQELARAAGHEHPLLIGTDQENGLVSAVSSPTAATQFPGAMALAATGSPQLTEQVYAASGRELKMLGIHWAYAPVADVNSDMRNPVIGVRSFGDDPNRVGDFVVAAAKGLTSSGIAPSAKHFPGHGDTHIDSHLALPRIMKTKEALRQIELVPFKQLFADPVNLATIMTGHMALPLVTGDDGPCSLSRTITTDLLKTELGFSGVIVTDCLEMDAVAEPSQGGCGVEEGAVRALEAGADIVMICHTLSRQVGAIQRVWKSIEDGRLKWNEVLAGGKKIQVLKEKFATATPALEGWSTLKTENGKLSKDAYARTIAIFRDAKHILPLKAGKTLLLTPAMESLNKAVDDSDGVLRDKRGAIRNTAGASYSALASYVQQRTEATHVVYSQDTEDIDVSGVEIIIFVMRTADRARWQIQQLEQMMKRASEIPIVLVSSCTPYDLVGVGGVEDCAYIGTFEFTADSFEALVNVLYGDKPGVGNVPLFQSVYI